MINRVILVGRITKDPELKYTQGNVAFVAFTVAVSRQFTNQAGEREADFISCIVWRQQAENLARFIKKGGLIGIEGRIETRTYDDLDGTKKYVTNVVCDSIQFLEPKGTSQDQQGGGYQPAPQTPRYNEPRQAKQQKENTNPFENIDSHLDISNDDLPF
jgi:single-strand DNA-binding protein